MKKIEHPELLPPTKNTYTKEDLGKFFWDKDMGVYVEIIEDNGTYIEMIDNSSWATRKGLPKCWQGPDPATPDEDNNW